MALKSGMGGGRPTKARNPEEMMREQHLMMTKAFDQITQKEISGSKESSKKADSRNAKGQVSGRGSNEQDEKPSESTFGNHRKKSNQDQSSDEKHEQNGKKPSPSEDATPDPEKEIKSYQGSQTQAERASVNRSNKLSQAEKSAKQAGESAAASALFKGSSPDMAAEIERSTYLSSKDKKRGEVMSETV